MTTQHLRIERMRAPAWNVDTRFNLEEGKSRVELGDVASEVVYLYGFQSWCAGCNSHGFPTMAAVQRHFVDNDEVAFVALQTVFEGFDVNGPDEVLASVTRHGLSVPVGHDPGQDGNGSDVIRRYRSGGTPWIVLIDQKGIIRCNGVQADPGDLIDTIEALLAKPNAETRLGR
jgi:thiol-disulfide isomerase/thioredoxin